MSRNMAMKRPYTLAQIDQNTSLCLACSCSLPPIRNRPFPSSLPPSSTLPLGATSQLQSISDSHIQEGLYTDYLKGQGFYFTPCCQKPICPACVKANSRLTRYDPCLACLGGVDAVGSGFSGQKDIKNIDGGVKDEDAFVVGEDEDDDDLPPPAYVSEVGSEVEVEEPLPPVPPVVTVPLPHDQSTSKVEDAGSKRVPWEYFLRKGDTLQGISLRYGLEGRELCRTNRLPMSVLTTTPHLLHTRSYILLPPSVQALLQNEDQQKEHEARRVRERAERELQTLMKEVDWRVAKAYVALADDEEQQDEFRRKRKEVFGAVDAANELEASAIDQYLDDDEWEANERRLGHSPFSPTPTLASHHRKQ